MGVCDEGIFHDKAEVGRPSSLPGTHVGQQDIFSPRQLRLAGLAGKRHWSPLGVVVKETPGHRLGREEPQERGQAWVRCLVRGRALTYCKSPVTWVTGKAKQADEGCADLKQVGVRCCVGKGD